MLGDIEYQLRAWRRPIMSFLLTPPRPEDTRRLPYDPRDLLTKYFVVKAYIIDALDTDIRIQMNGVADAAICPA